MGFLIVLFFIISPLIILYTAGYRYDAENGIILQTGVISIDVTPDNAEVYIGAGLVNDQLPLRITNVAPGSYPVRVEAEGYLTFTADLTVLSNETAFIRDLALVKEHDSTFFRTASSDTVLSPSGNFTVENIDQTYVIRQSSGELVHTIEQTGTLHTSPYSDVAMQLSTSARTSSVQLFSLDSSEDPITIQLDRRGNFAWHWDKATSRPAIYLERAGQIMRIDDTGKQRVVDTVTSSLWHVDDRGHVWVAHDKTLTQQSRSHEEISIEPGALYIVDITDERILIAYPDQLRIYDRRDGTTQMIQAREADRIYNTSYESWLAHTGNELWEITDTGNVTLLERLSTSITSAHRVPNTAYVAYTTPQEITLLDTFYGLRYTLATGADLQILTVQTAPNRVIYEQQGEWFTIPIE